MREQVCSGLEHKSYTEALCPSTIDHYGWLKWQLSLTGRRTWGTQDSLVLSKKIPKYAIRKSFLKYFNLSLLGKGRKREKKNSADKKQLIQSTESSRRTNLDSEKNELTGTITGLPLDFDNDEEGGQRSSRNKYSQSLNSKMCSLWQTKKGKGIFQVVL